MDDLIKISDLKKKYTSTGRHSGYQIDLYHSGFDEHKHISAVERTAFLGKVHNQKVTWHSKWEKELYKQEQQSKEETAKERTIKAQEKLQKIENILKYTLNINDAIDWNSLKHTDEFTWLAQPHAFIKFNKTTGYPEGIESVQLKVMP
jgi:restriction system protein